MDRFLGTYNLPKLSHEDRKPKQTDNQIGGWISNRVSTKKSPRPYSFTAELYQAFQELIPVLFKLLTIIEKEGIIPNTFYEANITLIPSSEKDTAQKENSRSISPMNIDAKTFNGMLANRLAHQKYYSLRPSDSSTYANKYDISQTL